MLYVISCYAPPYLIEAKWRKYASVNYANINSDNGLPPVWCQAIIWTIAHLLSNNKLQWNFNHNTKILNQEIVFENVICEMAAILSRPQWVILPLDCISGSMQKRCNCIANAFNSLRLRQNGCYFAHNISNLLSWMKTFEFQINFHWNMFLGVWLTIFLHWWQAIIWNQWCPILVMHICVTWPQWVNTLKPRQNGRHFPDDIFQCIFFNENVLFRLRFHWSLFPRVKLTIFQHWLR